MEKQLIGVATKPQALKGQFRIKPSILNFKQFKKIKNVFIDNSEYTIESCSIRDTFVIIKLDGIDTCEQAEKFRNKEVFAEIEVAVESHFDLTEFEVIIDGMSVGKVLDINNYGSKDILSISGNSNIMLPVIDDLIIKIDENNKQVILNKDIFNQVAVYED
jgi:16S rRNA processing protein RimM